MENGDRYNHERLDCGVELAALPIAGRRTTAFDIRILAGMADEPAELGGLAWLVEETIAKGTQRRSAQEMADALDALGAQCGSSVGRESFVFRCGCLPEYVERVLELQAEMLRTPTFPEEFCQIAADLGQQELTALEDDPGELTRKLIAPHAFGPLLGRHELGSRESLAKIGRPEIEAFWRKRFSSARMLVTIGGAVDVPRIRKKLDQLFGGFGDGDGDGRQGHRLVFSPGVRHHDKTLEQEHMVICWPGSRITDDDYPVERLVLAVLSDGMSSRLFTEVREKQGLVYWVGAWDEHPRGGGLIFLGASTTPARCDQTFQTLLREVDRLAEDITDEELQRAKVGIIAKTQTHGDITRARASELSSDLFHFGRPVPPEEKNRKVSAVTIADVKRYLGRHPRDRLSVLTLGPKALEVKTT